MQADAPESARETPSAKAPPVSARELFSGDGTIRAAFRSHDWSGTPIGDQSTWSPALRSSLLHILWSAFPNMVLWGPDLVQLYNEPYLDLVGDMRVGGLGVPTREAHAAEWDVLGPIYARVLAGETISRENAPFAVTRAGRRENLSLTLSYAPIHDEGGVVAGVLVTVFEAEDELYGRELH
ncbi:MAG: hypothetical protein M3Z05_15990 [Gemmatimonadota bacterium]|nr:hypothetical protein [Gemmatimonadota bacterium]